VKEQVDEHLNTSPSEEERIAFTNNTSADLLISLSFDRYPNEKQVGLPHTSMAVRLMEFIQ